MRVKSTNSRWIVGQVQEQTDVFHRAIFFEILFEEPSRFHVHLIEFVFSFPRFLVPTYTHSGENDGEIIVFCSLLVRMFH